MKRAEEITQAALQYANNLDDVKPTDEFSRNLCIALGQAFVKGAEWSDEHPALTWEDMMRIHKHLKDAMNYHLYELQNAIEGQKKVYQNVLDRFLKERNKED